MKRNLKILAVSISVLACGSIYAEDITICTQVLPSKTDKLGENQVGGIGGEIITKALAAKKISFKMNWLPWKRAQEETLANSDKQSFIIPFTRNAEREPNYNWVSKLYDAETVFITKKGTTKLNSISEAKGKKIGVLLGSSYETAISNEKNGLNKADIEAVPNDATNAKKLEATKIYAWYTGVIGAIATFNVEKMAIDSFEFGNKIDIEENYIATSKGTAKELVEKVKDAIEAFKKTAEYKTIIKKYTGK
ncbi:transporter substrate-binding domain-containing protein [Pigmentibacter sp. JX0631]|uniref:substrate-binding periplasmic protein n=1 Tax=Pigmentibacter sp. JX0631 TaxID=2976982 RepID=UPI002468CC18|nr:transporter substrate-binding domain-containing protein [Pigmentibacter sp. JX0631]WGL59878.1 transporter substrate-binding domain-containing protein [Pigmentibacter sp. JX0631]